MLCWIFENQGHCRYGAKCQWLHLDRETCQYVPTLYVTNSLDRKAERRDSAKKDMGDSGSSAQRTQQGRDEEVKQAEEEQEAEDSEQDMEAIKSKFQRLMEKNIARNSQLRAQEKQKRSQLEEDTKNESKEAEAGTGAKCPVATDRDSGSGKSKGGGNYGSYGTTFDRHNVCWEFNTFVGCRKGSACKWAHQYLAKESAHPYTGEKLNGMAVRKFRLSNNL